MKKTINVLLIAATLLGLSSCIKDSENHLLTIGQSAYLSYADQTEDSLLFYTYDSWKVAPQVSWITVMGDDYANFKYDNNIYYAFTVYLNKQQNTTGETRVGTVKVSSYDYDASGLYFQYGHLNITHPQEVISSYVYSGVPGKVSFTLRDSATVEVDSLCFTAYKDWNLKYADENDTTWLRMTGISGTPGKQTIPLSLTQNTDTAAREATVILTSGEVSNNIIIRQLRAKAKK